MRHLLYDLPVPLGREQADPLELLVELFGGQREGFKHATRLRQSLDARNKSRIRFLVSLGFETDLDLSSQSLPPGCRLGPWPELADFTVVPLQKKPRVVVVGTGPAGSFCALRLLDYGIEPILIERGPAMDERIEATERLWNEGVLNENANAQFGEGGAGTFSDGKLATRVDHPAIRYVLEGFVRFGASSEILHQAKAHVGTDVIQRCCVKLREEAQKRGASYRFNTRLTDLEIREGKVVGAVLENGEILPCDALVLAVGHSARDTFEMLQNKGIALRQKPFAMGLRIEHPQDLIDRSQYGSSAGHPSLGAADYKLVHNLGPDRAAYSFCMCPGGEVIQCASEHGGVVVNGMSGSKRDSGYANSGFVAKVNTADFGSSDVLAGMYLQRHWEQVCYRAAGESYGAPAMTVQDFLKGKCGSQLPKSCFRPFLKDADLRRCLPDFVWQQLVEALPVFERKIKGFTGREALLMGIESRTSSPIQILRGEDRSSVSHAGLYPVGEGAGYAGGITSAAVDGIRSADAIAACFNRE